MNISPKMFFVVCPLVFLAGMIDAIGGGGGLISLPAYLIAGVPPHMAIATNKLSSSCGTSVACYQYIKSRLVYLKLAIPTIISAMVGATVGAKISLYLNDEIISKILLLILPLVALIVLRNKDMILEKNSDSFCLTSKIIIFAMVSALSIGCYDGIYGPGTGTFLILALILFAQLPLKRANAHAKVINLTSNISSLIVFIFHGEVLFELGIAAAICNMLGAWFGTKLFMKSGVKIVKPSIIFVLLLLFLKILGVFDFS